MVHDNADMKNFAKKLFSDLAVSGQHQPIATLAMDATASEVVTAIESVVATWANDNAPEDPRFSPQ
jgi:hypothetical protein